MTPEEREARTAAYWKNALAAADPEHWEAILKKDIPMSAGRGNLLYGFTDDELDRALLDDPQVGEGGGHLGRYEIGQRVNHRTHCLRCGDPLTSTRPSAKYCNKLCRQRKPHGATHCGFSNDFGIRGVCPLRPMGSARAAV
jgi:hypothetical protein